MGLIKRLNGLLQIAGFQIKKKSALENERKYNSDRLNCFSDLYAYRLNHSSAILNSDITGFVFSRNRAMQLHALLASYFHYTKNAAPLKVLYTFDTTRHQESYELLKLELKSFPIEFITENNFQVQLKQLVNETTSDRIFFMTDDAIFLEDHDLSDVLYFNPLSEIFSLRLGFDVNFSFTHNKKQSLPDFGNEVINNKYFYTWIWGQLIDSPEWCYPLSVDATIFSKAEIDIIFKHLNFRNPNSLEANLQILNSLFLPRKGVCFKKAKYVNIPCNVVQNEFLNLSTGHFSPDDLLQLFLLGKRINWKLWQSEKAFDVQNAKFDFLQM